MADTCKWSIAQLERIFSSGAVYTVHWVATATRNLVSGDKLTTNSYGSIGLEKPDSENFTLYDELTEDQVLGWVFAALGDEKVESICNNLTGQLDAQQSPVNAPGIPW
jgi:hypothetical protein